MVDLANTVFRDFVTDGVPSSGANKTRKSDIRQWGAYLESLADLAYTNGKVYPTKAALDADLAPAANTPALVIGNGANDGLYMKVGATMAGSWTRLVDFVPGTQIVHAVDAGAGTPNAIIATSSISLSPSGSQLVRLDVFEANTGPASVAFNGATPMPIKTASGSDPVPGGLVPGAVLGTISGGTFRLLSDQASAAIVAAAEVWANAADASATASDDAAARSQGYAALAGAALAPLTFATVASLLADTVLSYTAGGGHVVVGSGDIIQAQGFRYQVAASGASDHNLITAGGVKLYVLAGANGFDVLAFGAKGDYDNLVTLTGTDDTLPIQAAFATATVLGLSVYFPGRQYRITDTISVLNASYVRSFKVRGESGNSTRIYFDNAVAQKNMFFFDTGANYINFDGVELIDRTAGTSRCFYFRSVLGAPRPSWKHRFSDFRVVGFWEGCRFDGDAANFANDAYLDSVTFLHGKFRNCRKSVIYNNIQAVSHNLYAVDFENDDALDVTEMWPMIVFERGSFVNHIGGDAIGAGSYVRFTYPSVGGSFQGTSQFTSRNVKTELRGMGVVIDQALNSYLTVSASMRIDIQNMGVVVNGVNPSPIFARFGGRVFANFKNVRTSVQMDVQAYMTSNLSANSEVGFIKIDDCTALNYKRVWDQAAYQGTAVLASNLRCIPASISGKNESTLGSTVGGYFGLLNADKDIYAGGYQQSKIKSFTFAPADTSGFGSGSSAFVSKIQVPLYSRPFRFRLLRDNVNSASPFVLALRLVANAPVAATISGCADNGGGLIRVTTAAAHGMATGDGVTIAGVTGTTEANGEWAAVTVISATTFDLQGSAFANAYVSGGTFTIDRTVASIAPTAGTSGLFEAPIQSAGLPASFAFQRDDVNWDGKMKITKSGTVNGFVGLIMVDYM